MTKADQIQLKDNTYLKSATSRFGNPIATEDDCWGPLWVCGEEFGASFIVRAPEFESAWEMWVNQMPTIPEAELAEAYGIESAVEWEMITACSDVYPELAECHEYQTQASGTGVVFTGYHAWLQPLTPEYLSETAIRVQIGGDPI